MFDLLLPPRCALCRRPGSGLCRDCAATLPPAPDLGAPPGLVACDSLLRYEGPTRELVAAVKFHGHRDAIPLLGATMARLVRHPIDVVTWAPTSAARRRDRGYDQAELLARAAAGALGRRTRGLLRRVSAGSQTGHDRAQRLTGPEFRARRECRGTVLLVDDVRTTGATLCAAADALTEAGATAVVGLTLAVTP
jgi:predicted amidophosphoribosyltransferase